MCGNTILVNEVTLHDHRCFTVLGRDKIYVYMVLFHVIQYTHPVFCAIQTGYGISIPTHVGENHHHITACATHVIGYGDSLPVPNQHIQAYKACTNYNIICFKFHVLSIKIQTSGLSLSTNSAFTFSHATCGSYSTCGPRIISVSVKNSSSCSFPSIFNKNSLYVGK